MAAACAAYRDALLGRPGVGHGALNELLRRGAEPNFGLHP